MGPAIYRASGCSGTVVEGIVLMRFGLELTREAVDVTREMQLAALAQRPAGIGILLVVDELPNKLPSSEVRSHAVSMAGRYSEGILAHATVMSGEGFTMSAIRSSLTGIFHLAKLPYPRTVVADVEHAIAFLRGHMKGTMPSTGDLVRIANDLPRPAMISAAIRAKDPGARPPRR